MPVLIELNPPLAIVHINNPPVNALSHEVRLGLLNACKKLNTDQAIKAVILICDGRTFIAGADIREFGQPPEEPHLPDVISSLEASTKPWIAAIHGTALGGGCEVTLGCHYRVAVPSAKLGLPEVNLGLIPGAGGTVRLPRLVGVQKAIEMVTSGKPIKASKAKEIGLIDALAPDHQLEQFAIEFATSMMNEPTPLAVSKRPITDIPNQAETADILAGIKAKARGQLSPLEAASSVLDACNLSVEGAFKNERQRFVKLKESSQSKALRYAFFAERQTTKIDELKEVEPREINHCGVVGGGTMGAGIATAMLLSGLQVTLIEQDEDEAATAKNRVIKTLEASLSRGLITQARFESIKTYFKATSQFEKLKSVDLVIEAIFEDMAVKRDLFEKLSKTCSKDTIFATNTSYLNINELAESTVNPERVIGLHFFSPAHIMKLLEVIKTDTVSNEVLATGFALGKKLRKVPVLSGVCDGFIGNRILSSYRKQCDYMLEDGASPQEIDEAMRAFGMAMGPFEMQDMAGLDIGWANRKRLAPTRDPNERYVKIADRLCELGRFGQKTGFGWYDYPNGARKGIPNSTVEAIIVEERAIAGIIPKSFSPEEIQTRVLDAMACEGHKILSEGIARSASDIDMVMILGYGFPRWRGGPMFMVQNK